VRPTGSLLGQSCSEVFFRLGTECYHILRVVISLIIEENAALESVLEYLMGGTYMVDLLL